MEEYSLIKFENGQLDKVGRALEVTNKLLKQNQRQELLSFFKRYPTFLSQLISIHYPLTLFYIKKYQNNLIWDFRGLSENKYLNWSEALIEAFFDKWNWPTDSLFRPIRQRTILHKIRMYRNEIKWQGNTNLSTNVSLPWSDTFIDKFYNMWNWERLSVNIALPWSDQLIEKYYYKWDWANLSGNKNLPWSENFIQKHFDKWDWSILSCNTGLPWSESLILKYNDKWDWRILSCNESLPWYQIIDKFTNSWDWNVISYNKGLPWNEQVFIDSYNQWNWKGLSFNSGLTWTESFINDNKDKFDWWGLSANEGLPWSENFIDQFSDKWNWAHLSSNEKIPWTLKFVTKHFEKLNSLSSNYSCWQKVFKPYIDNAMIDEVFTLTMNPEKLGKEKNNDF